MDLMKKHRETFRTDKPVIGCVHLTALPGTPHYDKKDTMKSMVERAKREIAALQNAGFDALVFANEGDRPYLSTVGPEIIACYTRVVAQALDSVKIPYGVGVLVDPVAAICIAKALDAQFIRAYIHGVYADMCGLHDFRPGELLRLRRNIDADNVGVYCYCDAHGGTSLDTRSQEDMADTAFSVLDPSGVLVPGQRAGLAPDFKDVIAMKKRFPDKPVLIGSGITPDNAKEAMKIADGMVVGTFVKQDGILWNEVDPERAKRFIAAAKG
ncbi:sgc region protein SgcQ [Spirochaetia bacterium]|nr:sgc region protein SgcQ [Spirochaetia bacterium]